MYTHIHTRCLPRCQEFPFRSVLVVSPTGGGATYEISCNEFTSGLGWAVPMWLGANHESCAYQIASELARFRIVAHCCDGVVDIGREGEM